MKSFSWLAASLCIAASSAGCVSAPTPAQVAAADYGARPTRYEDSIRAYFDATSKDPSSLQYREITVPEKGYIQGPPISGGKITYGWRVDASINGKNSYGGYVGFRTYQFLFRGEELVDSISPE